VKSTLVTTWWEGVVTSYSSTTLIVAADATSGSVVMSSGTWNLTAAGQPGIAGGMRYSFSDNATTAPASGVIASGYDSSTTYWLAYASKTGYDGGNYSEIWMQAFAPLLNGTAQSITVTITKESDPNSFQVHEISGLAPGQSIASIGSYTAYTGWSKYWATYGPNAGTYVDGYIASGGSLTTGDIVRVTISHGVALPKAGTSGQALAKSSTSDFDVAWTTLVPTGGTTGQVLAKTSGSNFAASWSNVSGVDKHPIPKAGATSYWGIPGVWSGAAYTTKTLAANILYYQPFIVSGTSAITVSAVGLNVSTLVASTSIRIGIYAADNNLQPTTLMVDAGTVSSATTGWKTITGLSTSLTPGSYVFAYVSNGAPVVSSLTGNSWFGYHFDPALPTNWLRDFRVSFTYGTLPTPTGTAWNTVQNNSGGSYDNVIRMLWS
jgi:hypothetical protein